MITKIKRKFNSLIHKEPYESLAYGVFWFLFLLVVVPLISLLVVIPLTIYRLVDWLLDSTLEVNTGYFDPKKYDEEREMAVIVTNCDVSEDSSSSYSKDIVLWAANAGFTVFAFCQSEESMKYYQTKNKETLTSRIIPIKVDITKDDDIQKAVSQISGWMNHFNLNDRNEDDTKEDQTKQRVVHALINNCGTSNTPGYFDWLDVTDCQESMNLNYFGMIRCCKAFVPIFKEQSKMLEGVSGGRIINITNISGLLPGSPFFWNYATTQHACQVFTEGLRKELSSFGIDVTTINPSYTQQQIVSGIETTVSKMWKTKMSVDKKQEYGEGNIDNMSFSQCACWASLHC